MIPAGYMAKCVSTRNERLKAPRVKDIYSMSPCISKDFADYIQFWQHNGYWLFDSPELILKIAQEQSIDLTTTQLFYYEFYELEFDPYKKFWEAFTPESSFPLQVVEPAVKKMEGFDVVTFSPQSAVQCSFLSCNHFAEEIPTNEHCLLESFDEAKRLVESGVFDKGSEGLRRIVAVHSVPWS